MEFQKMPKIDLHHHLDGAFRPDSLFDEAKRRNLPQAKILFAEFARHCVVPEHCNSLTDFLAVFDFFYEIGNNPEFLHRAAREVVEDMARDGVIYAETRIAPHLFGGSAAHIDVIEAILSGLQEGQSAGGPAVNLILCMMRGHDPKWVDELREAYLRYNGSGVVAIDLAGDESRFPGEEYTAGFKRIYEANIPVTIHAGEAAGPESVERALDLFHAIRIGHGIQSYRKTGLMERLISEQIPLEVCLTSNIQTGTVGSYSAHPFPEFLKQGLKVTLNTDDPGVSGITLSDEWELATREYQLSRGQQKTILFNSIDAAFIKENEKINLKSKISAFFSE